MKQNNNRENSMNKLINFNGRVGRLGFALIYTPMLIAFYTGLTVIQQHTVTDYFSGMIFQQFLSHLSQSLLLVASVFVCMNEKSKRNKSCYLILLLLGSINFFFGSKLFLSANGILPLSLIMFCSSLFMIFISGYVRRLHDLGWQASPAAKTQLVAWTLLYSSMILPNLLTINLPGIIKMFFSSMYMLSITITSLLMVAFVISLPLALLKSGDKETNQFGDAPKSLFGT